VVDNLGLTSGNFVSFLESSHDNVFEIAKTVTHKGRFIGVEIIRAIRVSRDETLTRNPDGAHSVLVCKNTECEQNE